MSDLFILGGKTRLAKACYLEATRSGRTALVLSTPADKPALLRHGYSADAVVGDLRRASAPNISIVVCAFGLVHPTAPDPQSHLGVLLAESRFLSGLMASFSGQIHVVMVSTVIALIPPRDRAYYAGFKNIAESDLAATTALISRGNLSILYPGRLIQDRQKGGLSNRLATPYTTLARRLLGITRTGSQTSRVVGWDARLWLLARTAKMLVDALRPTLPHTPVQLRDVPSRLAS